MNTTVIIFWILTSIAGFAFIQQLGGLTWLDIRKKCQALGIGPSLKPKMDVLNCRARLAKEKFDDCVQDVFVLEICGSVNLFDDRCDVVLKSSIHDISEGKSKSEPVFYQQENPRVNNSQFFCYESQPFVLSRDNNPLSDWIAVGRLAVDRLGFPRKGVRLLQLEMYIERYGGDETLDSAACEFSYANRRLGYLDLQENTKRAKVLALSLAFAVAGVGKKISDSEIEVVENWRKANAEMPRSLSKGRVKLNGLLNKAIFVSGKRYRSGVHKTCQQISEVASFAVRCDILNLCLGVVAINGCASKDELALLKDVAKWLQVDSERFRAMMEKKLPVSLHEVEDIEISLGITADMGEEFTHNHLSKEYRKWNARVTNTNPEVHAQASQMLELIAKVRSRGA